ncbi:Pycsar system effector family protein [Streptomyces harbinensis]|uniref:Pycsar system effector family protein n=1 Tax=Streptomyces harbinensis TaxID=1176198 RepID=UPI00367F3C2C
MTTNPDLTPAADTALNGALSEVQSQIARTDSKASVLMAVVTGSLAAIGAAGSSVTLPLVGAIAAGTGAAAFVVAFALLLSVVRPRLGGNDQASFTYWSRLAPDEVRESLAEDRRHHAIAVLSRIAVAKHKALQRAVDAILTGGALLVIAALTLIGGAL